MSILKYKYKAHKFINYAFYIVVFIFGFLLGFTTQKLDFNKLINQLLMIDNVSAYTIYEDENVTIDKEFIQNKFIEFFGEEIDFNVHKNYIASKQGYVITFELLDDNVVNNLYINSQYSNDSRYIIGYNPTPDSIIYNINYYPNSNSYYHQKIFTANGSDNLTTIYRVDTDDYYTRTNFDLSFATDEDNNLINQLDIHFNENLFKDNPNFKEVCIDKDDTIAITRIDNPKDLDYMTDYDYIWFPYEITGIKSYNYHNADISGDVSSDLLEKIDLSSDNIYEYDNYLPDFYADKKTIDSIFNDDMLGGNLEYKGYTNRYSYYGWTSALFNLWFDYRDGNDFNFFPIFEFQDSVKPNNLDDTEDSKICFYIKKEYSVTKVYKDEFNDVYGNVPTQNGDFNFTTSANKNNISTSGMMSQVNKFINHISGTINFIKDNVYAFYLSLPLIVRLFLTSALVLLIVKFIIGMVVR